MKILWTGIVFHLVVILWSYEEGLSSGKKSELCRPESNRTFRSRLVLVSIPGLSWSHIKILETMPGFITTVRVPSGVDAHLSATAGLDGSILLPETVDDIFQHANTTFFGFLPVLLPSIRGIEYRSENNILNDKTIFSYLKELLEESFDVDLPSKKDNFAEKALFYVRLRDFSKSGTPHAIRQAIRNLIQFKEQLDKTYKDDNTAVLVWGENDGPLFLWGDRFKKGAEEILSYDLTVLISAILRQEVPADSKGQLPNFLKSDEDKAYGTYCNAVQLLKLVLIYQDNDVIPFWTKFNVNELEIELIKSKMLLIRGKYLISTKMSQKMVSYCLSLVNKFNLILKKWRIFLTAIANLGYLALLLSELVYDDNHRAKLTKMIHLHLFFCAVVCCSFFVPFITPLPHTYHLYLPVTLMFIWAFFSRYKFWFYAIKCAHFRSIAYTLGNVILLCLVSEVSIMKNQASVLCFFICFLALLPTFPRVSKAPFLLTIGWFLTNAILFTALHNSEISMTGKEGRQAINLSATITLCVLGLCVFYVRPLKDKIVSIFIILLIPVGLFVQNTSLFFLDKDTWFLKYFSWPLVVTPFLVMIGEANILNRMVHVVSATIVVICLTSSRFEILNFFCLMVISWLWSMMETYKVIEQSKLERTRRSAFLLLLFLVAGQVVKSNPEAYRPFAAFNWFPIIDIYRTILVFACMLTIFLKKMKSESYSTIVLAMVINGIATLRTLFISGDLFAINLRGIEFIMAYYLAVLYKGKEIAKESNEDSIPDRPN